MDIIIIKIIKIIKIITIMLFYYYPVNNTVSQDSIENEIKSILPKNVFLREVEKIPDTKNDSYLGIYIEKPIIADIQKEEVKGMGLYITCPEQTMGQTIKGIYHIFLFKDKKIISDIVIPPSYSEDNTNTQELCYYNTRENLNLYFKGIEKYDEDTIKDLEKAKLIIFKDHTGSGLYHDFVLVGQTLACGWVEYLVGGYNEKLNRAEIYPINKNNKETFKWYPRFYPDNKGNVEVITSCGDHGNENYLKEIFKFNKQTRSYKLIDIIERPCE